MSTVSKRYSEKDLNFFKKIILKKIESAEKDLILLKESFDNSKSNGTNDTYSTFKALKRVLKPFQKSQTLFWPLDKKSLLET